MTCHGRGGYRGTFPGGQNLVFLCIVGDWSSWIRTWHGILLCWISYLSIETTSQVQSGPVAAGFGRWYWGWLYSRQTSAKSLQLVFRSTAVQIQNFKFKNTLLLPILQDNFWFTYIKYSIRFAEIHKQHSEKNRNSGCHWALWLAPALPETPRDSVQIT